MIPELTNNKISMENPETDQISVDSRKKPKTFSNQGLSLFYKVVKTKPKQVSDVTV